MDVHFSHIERLELLRVSAGVNIVVVVIVVVVLVAGGRGVVLDPAAVPATLLVGRGGTLKGNERP